MIQRAGLLMAAMGMLAIAVVVRAPFRMVPILLAAACLIGLSTLLSQAGRLSESLRGFRNRTVEIQVWGKPLDSAGSIESIRAIGPGLHFFVRRGDGSRGHLKIAQPRGANVDERAAEIREAAYVQWAGRKLARVAGAPAVTITAPR